MTERERKSPKFYVAEGIMFRLRESIAYVHDNQDCDVRHTSRRERAIGERLKQVLETLEHCQIITREENVEIRHRLWDLLDEDEEKRQKAAEKKTA